MSDSRNRIALKAAEVEKTFSFGTQKLKVLGNVNLEIEESSSLSIRGDSGCGKTTLLNLLARLETGNHGKVFWGDYEMDTTTKPTSYEIALRANFIGVVYQAYYLIPELNVLENILLASKLGKQDLRVSKDRAFELLNKMGVYDKRSQIPQKLSGGERQRVAIARALINTPKLVLADEPTGNLDEHTAGDVMELLLESCRENHSSLILVTHNPKFADSTDRTSFLKDGSILNL
ncbi:MAG: hypothetical protein CMI27_05845 [Opitutae bacterium]|nr:hypothetical protein [Opitutae bacterium]